MDSVDIRRRLSDAMQKEKEGKNRKVIIFQFGNGGRWVQQILQNEYNISIKQDTVVELG